MKLSAGRLEFALNQSAVLVESTLDRAHRSFGADPQLFADHSDQPFVVRHKNNAALKKHTRARSRQSVLKGNYRIVVPPPPRRGYTPFT